MVAKSKINKVEKITSEHWRLLLLADPSKHLVQNYLQMGQVFDIKKDDRPIAILVLEAVSERGLEIKILQLILDLRIRVLLVVCCILLFNIPKMTSINNYK